MTIDNGKLIIDNYQLTGWRIIMSHWRLSRDGKRIYVLLNDGSQSTIATVRNKRACQQMLRYAQAGEDIESVVDKLVGDTSTEKASARGGGGKDN